MTKNKSVSKHDLDELLAKSQRLAASSTDGSGMNMQFSRGVAELNEGSKQLSHGPHSEYSNLEAYRLLSQKNFDAKRLREDVNSIILKPSDESGMTLEGTDIEGYLAHHHDMIILAAIEEAKRGSAEDVQEVQRRWRMNEWSNARTQFMESLGHRSNRWENQANVQANDMRNGFNTLGSTISGEDNQSFFNAFPVSSPFNNLLSTPTMRKQYETPGSKFVVPSSVVSSRGGVQFSDLLRKHIGIIRSLNIHYRQASSFLSNFDSNSNHFKPFEELSETINIPLHGANQSVVSDGLTKSDLIAYKSFLDLMSFMVGEKTNFSFLNDHNNRNVSANSTTGYFTSNCFDFNDVNNAIVEDRKKTLTFGSKVFFEYQIYEVWSKVIDEAVAQGDITFDAINDNNNIEKLRSTVRERLLALVEYKFRLNQIPSICGKNICESLLTRNNKFSTSSVNTSFILTSHEQSHLQQVVPLWPFIYHCLRVNELDVAVHELNACVSAGYHNGEGCVATILKMFQLVAANYNTSKQSEASLSVSDSEIKIFFDAIQQCKALLMHEYSNFGMSNTNENDPYRTVVLNLCGLVDRDGLANAAFKEFSLEDFLWSHLWFIEKHRAISALLSSTTTSFSATVMHVSSLGSLANKYRLYGEYDLFDLMLQCGGEDYFDENHETPFKYATILACCHRFGDAISHLWISNKTIPSVNLLVACLHYGLILPHMPLTQNPSHPLVSNRSVGLLVDPTPSSVLQIFVKNVLFNSSEVSVDYLISLDCGKWINTVPILSNDFKETFKLKAQALAVEQLEIFLLTLDRTELVKLVGEPIEESHIIVNKSDLVKNIGFEKTDKDVTSLATTTTNKPRYRTGGKLDSYMDDSKINVLLSFTAYHSLTKRGDVDIAIFLYLLCGSYVEAVENMCIQLSNSLIATSKIASNPSSLLVDATSTASRYIAGFKNGFTPSKQQQLQQLQSQDDVQYTTSVFSQRDHWRSVSEHFIEKYLNNAGKSSAALKNLTQSGNRSVIDALLILTKLLYFVDSIVAHQYEDALELIDQLNILPTNDEQIVFKTSINPLLIHVFDVLLIETMKCVKSLYSMYETEKTNTGGSRGLLSDTDLKLQNLKKRSKVLVNFANKIKSKLTKNDTISVLNSIDSSIIF